MDYTLQLQGEKRIYPVPNGLYELLSDIAREVLRAQPIEILAFISQYLEALVTTRGYAKDAVAIVKTSLNEGAVSIKLCVEIGVSLNKANKAASAIQAAWRAYAWRKKFLSKPITQKQLLWDLDTYLDYLGVTYLQAVAAAIKIQSAWRGYMQKKRFRMRVMKAKETPCEWAYQWLKEFEKPSKFVKPATLKDILVPLEVPSMMYLPRRMITMDRHKLQTLFHGEQEDYEALEAEIKQAPYPDLDEIPPFVPTDRVPCYKEIHGEGSDELEIFLNEYLGEEIVMLDRIQGMPVDEPRSDDNNEPTDKKLSGSV